MGFSCSIEVMERAKGGRPQELDDPKNVMLNLDGVTRKRLQALAEVAGESRSWVVREALARMAKGQGCPRCSCPVCRRPR